MEESGLSRVLVTGASGFVGRMLVERLVRDGVAVHAAGRAAPDFNHEAVRSFAVGAVGSETDWGPSLGGCDIVVHLAAQVPVAGISAEAFDEVNDRGTARLVDQARAAKVRRFVHLSSVFAIVENAASDPVSEATPAAPTTRYGISKLAAELHVKQAGGTILRPPLVYGVGAQGNWRLLERLAASGIPLPFGAVRNRRSLIAVDNLVSAISHLVELPNSSSFGGTYMIADSEPVSLAQIIMALRAGMGMPPRLFAVPGVAMKAALTALGRQRIAKSLLDDFVVDAKLFGSTFGWVPSVAPADGIRAAGAAYRLLARR